MTKEARIVLFTGTLEKTVKLRLSAPDSRILTSIEAQLQYLIDVCRGTQSPNRLNEIILGIYAVREIDGWDDELANCLYACAAEVRKMLAPHEE